MNFIKKKGEIELQEKDFKILHASFWRIFPKIIKINALLETYAKIEDTAYLCQTKPYIKMKTIKIFLFICYFVGWFYILLLSCNTLGVESYRYFILLEIFEKMKEDLEPFSNILL